MAQLGSRLRESKVLGDGEEGVVGGGGKKIYRNLRSADRLRRVMFRDDSGKWGQQLAMRRAESPFPGYLAYKRS